MSDTTVSGSPLAPRPSGQLVREVSDMLARIQANYEREGSGPGSRFEGRLLEDVQAEAVLRRMGALKHNHPTRDIKAPGQCPACDAQRIARSA